ncbi:arginine deiminase [Thermoplasma volcanium GSS1]|uniref:Arginine deiminase n=1 Tax=Thermoplasma volcanium (strain ATCC 51530 / DSM 4299 / JCM 9571 / NBRC 15438 / GSS1) TaxID=273116 RepID=Q97BH9_THEVO|nr:arginine deiminase family protein [Thermoplasma volcanium]BAB59618.1 arginine deiminase [Thermoplasma volcanium GSS1]
MRARSEWSPLREVMIHRPSIEIEYAMLAPRPFLFERVFSVKKAIEEHIRLEEILRENGIKVYRLEEEIIKKADYDANFRELLLNYVRSIVHFYGRIEDIRRAENEFAENIRQIDSKTLLDYLILEPSIDLKNDYENSGNYPTVYSNIPLANLYFMRDQQAVADSGVIIGNMKREQRKSESDITSFVLLNVFGETDAFKMPQNAHFEGGDFMPAGDFAFIGTGSRTDYNGAFQALSSGKIDCDEVLVVENPKYEFSQEDNMVNMHLDTYFNLAGDGIAVTSTYLAKRAKARVYGKKSRSRYEKLSETNLYEYLKEKGFNFIDLTVPEQLAYSSNFLTISDRKIISVNVESVIKRLISQRAFDKSTEEVIKTELSKIGEKIFPNRKEIKDFGIDFIDAELIELTGGYGGAHCMTATLNRN